MPDKKIVLVSGANRGLGFEISKGLAKKGFRVVLTARDPKKGKEAADRLKADKLDVVFHPLDVTQPKSIHVLYQWVDRELGQLDVLINNAGVFLDKQKNILDIDFETVRRTIDTNVYGHFLMSQTFIPLMKKRRYGRIVNLSSGLGTLSDMEGGDYPSYRLSKTALNALTRMFAAAGKKDNILVNSMCPGWCRTDMGGPSATRSPEEGADTAIYLATLPDNGPTGLYFRDRKVIEW